MMNIKKVHYCAHLGLKEEVSKDAAFEMLTDLAKNVAVKKAFQQSGEPLKVLRENADGDPSIGEGENDSKVSIKISANIFSVCFSHMDDYYPRQGEMYTLLQDCIRFLFRYMKPKPVIQGYFLRGIAFADELEPGYINKLQDEWFKSPLKGKLDDEFSFSYEIPDFTLSGIVKTKVEISGRTLEKSKKEILQVQYEHGSKFYEDGMEKSTILSQIQELSTGDIFDVVVKDLPNGEQ